jgi:hypothetical protein
MEAAACEDHPTELALNVVFFICTPLRHKRNLLSWNWAYALSRTFSHVDVHDGVLVQRVAREISRSRGRADTTAAPRISSHGAPRLEDHPYCRYRVLG